MCEQYDFTLKQVRRLLLLKHALLGAKKFSGEQGAYQFVKQVLGRKGGLRQHERMHSGSAISALRILTNVNALYGRKRRKTLFRFDFTRNFCYDVYD